MNNIKLYLSVFAFCVFLIPTQAQENRTDSLLNRELTLEREYNPDINKASKVNQLPELREPQATKSIVEFSNYAAPYQTQPGLYLLPAQSYSSTELARVKKIGYLTAGVSSLLDIDADLGVHLINKTQTHLGVFASHRSSNSNVTYLQNDEKQKMKINDNLGGVNFLHDFGKLKLNAGAKYTNSAFNYYGNNVYHSGYQPALDIELHSEITTGDYDLPIQSQSFDRDTKQTNNMLEATAGIVSAEEEELSYLLDFTYKLFNQKHGPYEESNGRKENQIIVNTGAGYTFNNGAALGLLAGLRNYSYGDSNNKEYFYYDDENYSTISFNPYVGFEGSNWNIRLGVKEEFQIGDRKKANLAPDVYLKTTPTDWFQLDLWATGGIRENSNYSMFYENRYVNPRYRIPDSRIPLDANLGLTFLLKNNLKMNIFGGYELIKNEHFFYTQAIYVLYPSYGDRGFGEQMSFELSNASRFKIGFALDYDFQDIFELRLKGTYNKWDEWNVKENYGIEFIPYSKPEFVGDINLGYKFSDLPLRLDAYYHLETGRKFRQEEEDKTFSVNDLSLKANYQLNNTFSFFLKANNLLFQKYDLWYGFPAQDFNIMGGLSIKF